MTAGGSPPAALVREGLLDSALHRPMMAALYEGADLIRQAALLAAGIAQNHPFDDGNKRTAMGACIEFLEENGVVIDVDPIAIADQLILVVEAADCDAATGEFEAWLRMHVSPSVA